MGAVKSILCGTLKGIVFLLCGALRLGFWAIKILILIFLLGFQLFLVLVKVGTSS